MNPNKKTGFISILIVFICFFSSCRNSPERKYIDVSSILSGNTIQLSDGSLIIMLGIYDSPESQDYLASKLSGRKVVVFFDKKGRPPSSAKTKVYYAYVLDENKICVNAEMLKTGSARFCADYLGDSLLAFSRYAKYAGSTAQPPVHRSDVPAGAGSTGSVTTVRMTKRNGVYEVPIEINDIPMNFIFDTGASAISISLTEVEILLDQGKISRDDFIRKQSFVDATGRVSEGAIIRLRKVKIGDKIIKDVEASVVNTSNAPLLFGQSALERFGKVSIDYNNQLITLER